MASRKRSEERSYESASLLRISLYIIIFAFAAGALIELVDEYGNLITVAQDLMSGGITYQVDGVYAAIIVGGGALCVLIGLIFLVATIVASVREARASRYW